MKVFLNQYVSPLLRWDGYMITAFKDYIDWEWGPWIEVEYAHTAHTITPEMREAYVVD